VPAHEPPADNPRTRNSAYGLCIGPRGVLLVRMGEGIFEGEWTVPGGQLLWGEHPEDAVRREVFEETGLVAEVGPLLGVFSHGFLRSEERPYDSVHVIGLYYAVTRLEGVLCDEPGTGHHAEWVPLAALRERRLSAILEGAAPFLESSTFQTQDQSQLHA
jgi:8-oxo-dGTP diphosphatase